MQVEALAEQSQGWVIQAILAIVIFIVGRMLARWVSDLIRRAIKRSKIDLEDIAILFPRHDVHLFPAEGAASG